jgi:hypothetical protein
MGRQKIMYIESKSVENDLIGDARIGRMTFSKTGKSLHYKGLTFETLSGTGFKANYFEVVTGDHYWISGCKKNGEDRLYGERLPIYIDDDAREEYWIEIRNLPDKKHLTRIN